MKKLLVLATLGAASALMLTGCETATGVNNPDDSTGYYNNTTGILRVRYAAKSPEYIENVFNATNHALDQLGYFRTGQTPGKDKVEVFARAIGDVSVDVDISKKVIETKEGGKQEWIYVVIKYGTFGNLKESQQIAAKISENLFKQQ